MSATAMRAPEPGRTDVLLGAGFALLGGCAAWLGAEHLGPELLHYSTWDVWFDADPPAVADMLLDPNSRSHLRSSHHPLFSLVVYPAAWLLRTIPGVTDAHALSLLVAITAALAIGLLFTVLRALALDRTAAAVFTLLGAASAAFFFWMPVLEAQSFGTVTVLGAIALVAAADRGWRPPFALCVAVSVATLSMTTSNWVIGLLALAAVLPWRRAIAAATVSGVASAGLWWLQRALFPATRSPLHLGTAAETNYLFSAESLGVLAKLRAFFAHSIVLPQPELIYGFRLSVQGRPLGAGLIPVAGLLLWAVLLIAAVPGLIEHRESRAVRVLVAALVANLAIAIVFGVETFFYSLYFAPLLLIAAAHGALTKARTVVVTIAGLLTILATLQHVPAFRDAGAAVRARYESERAFTAAVPRTTPPGEPLVCGREALAAEGAAAPGFDEVVRLEAEVVTFLDDPDTCFYRFGSTYAERTGWILPFELWSPEAIEALRGKGARWFVTSYAWGAAQSPELFEWLDEHHERIVDEAGMRIYRLTPPVLREAP